MLSTANHQGNANQNHKEITTSHLSESLSSKRRKIIDAGGDAEKRESLHTTDGNVNWGSQYGKQYRALSKK